MQAAGRENQPDESITRMLEAYKAAVFAKDPAAFASLYDRDVLVFDLWAKWSYQGLAAWRAMAEGWFKSLGTERVVVEVDGAHAVVSDDIAVVHAFFTYKGLSSEGRALHSIPNRMTWALRRREEGWKIIHEHSSAPIDAETSKVVLERS